MPGERIDPYLQINFVIEIEGKKAGFAECSGLTTDTDVVEYREGTDPHYVRKLPGLRKVTNIVLKRGFTQDKSLYDWRKTVLDGKTERKNGSIVLRDEAGKDVLRWNFFEGWPVKWEGPALNAETNEVAIETLEIALERLELA